MNKKIVMLVGSSKSSRYVYNYLKSNFMDVDIKVIGEHPPSRKKILLNRAKKLGFCTVLGQVLFMMFIPKILNVFAKKRVSEIERSYHLNGENISNEKFCQVENINSDKVASLLIRYKPDLVIVNGTRILRSNILKAVNVLFINTHVGITPLDRGVHGGYWALANKDSENCGVTVHFVDQGVDTGDIIAQKIIQITKQDSFVTYPLIQLGEALILLKIIVKQLLLGEKILPKLKENNNNSKQYYHPTLWFYLFYRVFKGVK